MKVELIKGTPDDLFLQRLEALELDCFGSVKYDANILKEELDGKSHVTTFFVEEEGEIIAFKMGYERRLKQYYSWLGGVHSKYRKKGLAKKLMVDQHSYLKNKEYICIRTQTGNEFKNMLILNIKTGFDIIGTFLNSSGNIRITLEKKL